MKKKLSFAQFRMLESIEQHGDPWAHIFGAAAHGGASGTIASLSRLKYIKPPMLQVSAAGEHVSKWQLTDAGKAALKLERHRQCLPAKHPPRESLGEMADRVLGVDILVGSKRIKAKKRKANR